MSPEQGRQEFQSKTGHDFQVSVENYLKAIWNLMQLHPIEGVTNARLAKNLAVSRPSVTGMIRKLERLGLVQAKEKRFHLSMTGRQRVFLLLRRHRIIELFLNRTLDLEGLALHDEAERLEHAVSDQLLEKMNQFLGSPELGLDGMPIPGVGARRHNELHDENVLNLLSLPVGQGGLISALADYDRSALIKILGLLSLGDEVEKISQNAQDIEVKIRNRGQITTLSLREAELVRIEVRDQT